MNHHYLSISRLLAYTCLIGIVAAQQATQAFTFTYTIDPDAKVSALICRPDGFVVRELLHAAPQDKGVHTERWDGLDEKGNPVPAGDYIWKVLATPGLTAEYLLTLGSNPSPDWLTWPGNHGAVSAVTVDETGAYFAGGCGEGNPLVIKQSLDGSKRLWDVPRWLDAWMGGYSLTTADGKLYLLQQNGVIQCIDASTGEHKARWDVIWEKADREGGRDTHLTMDIDARDEQLVASYATHNAIRWLNPQDGKTLDEAVVPNPLGIAVAPTGQVLVISEGKVVTLSRAEKTPKVLISDLVDPLRLDVDDATGEIFVAERGASQQVKRFDATGKLLQAYGTPGGRPREGRYDPKGFANIDDIAADGQGGFIAVEAFTAPRRAARFDKDGTLVREWYGGQQYATQGVVDPAAPSFIWIESQWSSLIQCKVDYQRKTWQVYATYNYGMPEQAAGMIPGHHHGHSAWNVFHRGGQTYLARESSFPCILRVDEANRRLVPVMSAFIIGRPNLPITKEAFTRPDTKKAPNANITLWTDRNADGIATVDEITGELAPKVWGSGHSCYDPKDFTFYSPRLNSRADRTGPSVLKVQEWLPGGIPVYGFGDNITFFQNYPDDFAEMQTVGLAIAKDGNRFGAFHVNMLKPIGVNGFGANGGNRVIKFTKDGKIVWVVGRAAPGSVAKPGEAKSFYSIGSVKNCAVVSDYADSMIHVWDEDGLFVGRLLDEPNLNVAPRLAYELCHENFGNSVYEVPAGMKVPGLQPGDVLLVGGGQNNTPVYRISGWDQFKRQQGTLTITPAQATQLTARVETERTRPELAHITRLRNKQIKLDGVLEEWKDVKPLEIMDGDEVRAKVYLGWSNAGLFAAFEVYTDTPWMSSVTTDFAFQGGAAVDVKYGPLQPARQLGGAGDVRVVASPLDGATQVVEFLPVLPADMPENLKQPVTYQTGQGAVTFARVAALPNGAVSMKPLLPPGKGESNVDNPTGYIVEMRIPAYGITLLPGTRMKFDASVILADLEGKRTTVRLPWHSRVAGDAIVSDVYHESLLRPEAWGEAVLEP